MCIRRLPDFTDHTYTRRNIMPFANFKFPEGTVDATRKEEIIHRTTAMFVEYFGEGARPHSMVLVEEVADGGWGRADETLTLAKMGIPAKSKE
jgi:4-oxalocrotonate tautomerase